MFGVFKEIFLMFEDMILTMTPACSVNVNYWRCCNTIFWIFGRCQFVRLLLIIDHCVDDDFDVVEKREVGIIGRKLSRVQPRAHGSLMSQFMLLSSKALLQYPLHNVHTIIAIHCTALQYYGILHCTVLFCTVSKCIVVHYMAL